MKFAFYAKLILTGEDQLFHDEKLSEARLKEVKGASETTPTTSPPRARIGPDGIGLDETPEGGVFSAAPAPARRPRRG